MDIDLKHLLDLNLQIEGCIRILMARPSTEAEEQLRLLIGQFQTLMPQEEKSETTNNVEPLVPQEQKNEIKESIEPLETQQEKTEVFDTIESVVEEIPGVETKEIFEVKEPKADEPMRIEDILAPTEKAVSESLAPKDEYRVENMIAQKESRDFGRAITLNDRYRFTRGLFEGDKDKFDDTIKKVEKMESLSEAYEYFLCELNWDADQPEASDFLTLVANHFNSAE